MLLKGNSQVWDSSKCYLIYSFSFRTEVYLFMDHMSKKNVKHELNVNNSE